MSTTKKIRLHAKTKKNDTQAYNIRQKHMHKKLQVVTFFSFLSKEREKSNQKRENTLFSAEGKLRLTPSQGRLSFDEFAHQTNLGFQGETLT